MAGEAMVPFLVSPPALLGEGLVARKLITPEQLAHALELQSRTHGLLGQILVAEGYLSPLAFYRFLAENYQLPFLDLLSSPPSTNYLIEERMEDYLHYSYLPLGNEGGKLLIATTCDHPELHSHLAAHYGQNYRLAITCPRDIRYLIEQHFGQELTDRAQYNLYRLAPQFSALHTLSERQRAVGVILLLLFVAGLILVPALTGMMLFIFLNLLYTVCLGFKTLLFVLGQRLQHPMRPRNYPLLADEELPVYTVLVPLYREPEIIPLLMNSLRSLDYPRNRLDIKLILEEDDEATYQRILSERPESYITLLRVPYSYPRTKPKACNYGLRFARGSLITIYDAEDIPAPNQLKQVASQFAYQKQQGNPISCIQARLNYYNWNHNLLTRLFSMEYSLWFDYWLPAMEKLKLPLPLGGTSNHLTHESLIALGDWDPFNVTEDADLGIRLASKGMRCQTSPSLTLEEAPTELTVWLRQRCRWIKGYIQTWLVHMRYPVRLRRSLGYRGFWGFQLFIGAPALTFLAVPLGSLILLLLALSGQLNLENRWLIYWAAANLLAGIGLHWFFGFILSFKEKNWRKLASLLVFPFYWLLHSAACIMAVWQLAIAPHHWNKTPHGNHITSATMKK